MCNLENFAAVLSGFSWNVSSVTYSYQPILPGYYEDTDPEQTGFAGLNGNQITTVEKILEFRGHNTFEFRSSGDTILN
jgi:hypothetical protein